MLQFTETVGRKELGRIGFRISREGFIENR